jgi:hypothetical protein
MSRTAGFRFSADVVSDGIVVHVDGQFAAPDRVLETVTASGHPAVELLFAGAHAFRRDPATGKWAGSASPPPSASTNPRGTFATLAQATSVHEGNGETTFLLERPAASRLISGAGHIKATAVLGATGSLESLALLGDDAHHTSMRLTYDVRSTPAVTLPPGV